MTPRFVSQFVFFFSNPALFPFTCTRGCGKMFRTAATRDKHSRSSCNKKLTCEKCSTDFTSKRKYTTHLRRCDGEQVSTAPLVRPASPPPLLHTSGPALPRPASPPPPGGLDLPGACGDMGVRGEENQYSVTFDYDLPTMNQTSVPRLFDIDTYLAGDIDIDDLLNSVH